MNNQEKKTYDFYTANMTWHLLGILFIIIGSYNKYGFIDTCLILGSILIGTFIFLDIKVAIIYFIYTNKDK